MFYRQIILIINDVDQESFGFHYDDNPIRKTDLYVDWLREKAKDVGYTNQDGYIGIFEGGDCLDKFNIQDVE